MKKHIKGLKGLLLATVSVGLVLGSVSQAAAPNPYQLKLERSTFAPGESIDVGFKVSGKLDRTAWVGIIPANVTHGSEAHNDQYDISYQYLNGSMAGEMTFKAPSEPGRYDFRLNSTDSNGRELTYVSFTVAEESEEVSEDVFLSLPKKVYNPGESIVVSFKADPNYQSNAWVGIIPSKVSHGSEAHNDQYDLTYQYLEGQSEGKLRFSAPSTPGKYDFRMHDTDSDGSEVYSVSFTVR